MKLAPILFSDRENWTVETEPHDRFTIMAFELQGKRQWISLFYTHYKFAARDRWSLNSYDGESHVLVHSMEQVLKVAEVLEFDDDIMTELREIYKEGKQ